MVKQKCKHVSKADVPLNWLDVESSAENAVVQIFAQVTSFNWLEPYRIEAQYENRGTGFFIDGDGYVVTVAHVVDEAKRIWINVPALGRIPLHAQIVGFCPDRDLALLRIDQEAINLIRDELGEIIYCNLGDSDTVRRTEDVLSLGYPLGQYRLKSSTGVVSGLESVEGRALIQITAPINPGNSGGPLLNINNEVIGIAIASMELTQNIGYVIPINELKMILDDLRTRQFVRMPKLGFNFSYSSDEKAAFLGNPLPAGLYVNSVLKNSLFGMAGVQEGDMLYEFNGFAVDCYGESRVPWSADTTTLYDLMGRVPEGHKVSAVFYRNGKKHTISFNFDLTLPLAVRQMYPAYEPIEYELVGGLVIMELADNHITLLEDVAFELLQYRLVENQSEPAIVVANILTGSYAHQVQTCAQGAIITQVNGKKVGTFESFKAALRLSSKTGFVTIKTSLNILTVFSLERLLVQEKQLSQDFVYPVSKTIRELAKDILK